MKDDDDDDDDTRGREQQRETVAFLGFSNFFTVHKNMREEGEKDRK